MRNVRTGAWLWRFGVATVALLVGAVVGAGRAEAQTQAAVSIIDFAFQPQTVTVSVGGRVTWTNTGMAPHTTSSLTGVWDSGTLQPRATFSFTFNMAGTFQYRCNIHPSMMGTVVVQAAGAAAQPTPAATARPQAAVATPRAQAPAVPAAAPRTGTGADTAGGVSGAWPLLAAASALIATGAVVARVTARRVRR
jgi:plastocyanin